LLFVFWSWNKKFYLFLFLFLLYYCCSGGTLWHLQKCSLFMLVKFTLFPLKSALLLATSFLSCLLQLTDDIIFSGHMTSPSICSLMTCSHFPSSHWWHRLHWTY
jgi:hypothetical protein